MKHGLHEKTVGHAALNKAKKFGSYPAMAGIFKECNTLYYSLFPRYLVGFARGFGYFLVGLSLLFGLVYFERERLITPLLKEYIPELIASNGGPLLRLGHVSGNYFSGVNFQNISLADTDPRFKSLNLSSVKLSYSFSDLLSGIDVFLGGLKVYVLGGNVEINVPPKATERVGASVKPQKRAGIKVPDIKADDFSLKINRSAEHIEFRHAQVEVSRVPDSKKRVNISVPEILVQSPLINQQPFSLNTRFLISTSGIFIEHASVNGSTVTKSAKVEFGEGALNRVSGDFIVWGGEGTADFQIDDGTIHCKGDVKGINVGEAGRYFSLVGIPEEGVLDMNLNVTGQVSHIQGSTGYMHAKFKKIKIGENLIDEAYATVQATDELILIESAGFNTGENRVQGTEIKFLRKSLQQGNIFENPHAVSGKLKVLLRNVPDFLSMIKVRPFSSNLQFPEHEFSGSAVIGNGAIHIKKGHLKSGGSSVDIRSAEIPLFANLTDPKKVPIKGEGRIRLKKLTDITEILSLPPVNGSLSGDVTVSGTLADPNASFSLNAQNVSRGGLYFDSVEVDGKVDRNRVSLVKVEALRDKDTLNGRGSYDKLKRRFEKTRFSLTVRDVSVYRSLIQSNLLPDSGRFSGSATMDGSLEEPEIVTSATVKKWRYSGISIFSGEIKARLKKGRTDIERIKISTSEGDFTGGGSVLTSDVTKVGTLNLSKLFYRRGGLRVKLSKPARMSLAKGGGFEVDQISLAGASGKVQISGNISPELDFDLNMVVTKGTSDGLPKGWVPARIFFEDLEFKSHLTGSLMTPELSVSGKVKKVGPAGGPLYLQGLFGFVLSRSGIHISQFNFSDMAGHRINFGGRIPFKSKFRGKQFREIKVDGDVSIDEMSDLSGLFFSGPLPSGSIVSRISVRGTPDEPTGELHIHTKNFSLPIFKRFPFVSGVTGDVDIRMDQRKIKLDKVSLVSDELDFSASGSWRFGKIFEQILNGEKFSLSDSLDTSGELKIKDLGVLTGKVSGLRRLEGAVTVKGHLTGSIVKPNYRITLFTKDSKLKANATFPSFADISGKISFENERVDPELGASLGGSPVSLVGTIFWKKKPYRFNIHFEGDNILYYRTNGLKVRGNTSLHLSGDAIQPELKGVVALTDSKFVRNVDFLKFLRFRKSKDNKKGFSLFSLKSRPFKDAKLDIAITSKEPFRLKNNFVSGTLRPELRLQGTGEVPSLDGNIYIDPTVFQLPYGNLKVTGGFLRFNGNSPGEPTLDLNAEGRLLDYDISLHAEGPINDPVVTLSSVPPLPEDELLLLVLAGELPKDSDVAQKKGLGLNVAVYLSRSLLLKLFQSDSLESDESILDRFDIEVGRNLTDTGAETVEAQFFIDRNVIGKREEWFLTSERDRFDDFNSGLRVVFKFE